MRPGLPGQKGDEGKPGHPGPKGKAAAASNLYEYFLESDYFRITAARFHCQLDCQ